MLNVFEILPGTKRFVTYALDEADTLSLCGEVGHMERDGKNIDLVTKDGRQWAIEVEAQPATFSSTGDAYDWSQCNEVTAPLVVPSEGVVGFLCDAWPVAVTVASGALHTAKEGVDPLTLADERVIREAVRAAARAGYAIREKFVRFADRHDLDHGFALGKALDETQERALATVAPIVAPCPEMQREAILDGIRDGRVGCQTVAEYAGRLKAEGCIHGEGHVARRAAEAAAMAVLAC